MLESTLAYARGDKEEKVQISLYVPVSIKECVDDLAKKEKVSATSIIVGALTSICEEWKSGACETITKERSDMCKLLFAKEDEIMEFLANPEDNDGFEYRGYYFQSDFQMNKQTIDILIDQIERCKIILGEKDKKMTYRKDIE